MVCSAARSLSLCCRQIFFVPSLLLRGLLLGEMASLSNDTPESTLPALLIFFRDFLDIPRWFQGQNFRTYFSMFSDVLPTSLHDFSVVVFPRSALADTKRVACSREYLLFAFHCAAEPRAETIVQTLYLTKLSSSESSATYKDDLFS